MKPTLCVDARMFRSSGIGTCLRNILQALYACGEFHIHILASKNLIDHDKELISRDCIEVNSPIYSIQEQFELSLKIPKCDVFWSPHYNVPCLPIKAKSKLVTIHDLCHIAYGEQYKFHQRSYAKMIIHKAIRRSDLVITDSNFSKQEIQKYIKCKGKEIKVVHLGVDIDRFFQRQPPTLWESFRLKYKVPAAFFLYVGNIKPHKNVEKLIDAYRIWVKERGADIHLVLLGKQFASYPLAEKISHDKELKNQVHFLQNINDEELAEFYKHAILTILPSLYEGFGFPPLEAMACNCPVIVSNVVSLPEVCGPAAVYCNPMDPRSIFKAICSVSDDQSLRNELKEKGRERVRIFSWDKCCLEYIQHFHTLARK